MDGVECECANEWSMTKIVPNLYQGVTMIIFIYNVLYSHHLISHLQEPHYREWSTFYRRGSLGIK